MTQSTKFYMFLVPGKSEPVVKKKKAGINSAFLQLLVD